MERLKEYRRKRDFHRTPEPSGDGARAGGEPVRRARPPAAAPAEEAAARFVVHKHAARRLHYDLRLEDGGVLRSWALPKGPSLEPGEGRLAVEVEDHPLEYADFEGVIPKGEYGGGTVMLWDDGTWRRLGGSRDRLDVELVGRKLRGRWTLARMTGRAGEDGTNWLMIRRRDDPHDAAVPGGGARDLGGGVRALDDVSVATGRSMDEIAAAADRVWTGRDAAAPDELPELQLARSAERAPEGDGWLHEIKFDGYRIVADVGRGRARLRSRNRHDWTERFPEIARALASLPDEDAVLDGEVVALLPDGRSSFTALQEALSAGATRGLVYQAFDLLRAGGRDLRRAPLTRRKAELHDLVGRLDARARRAVRATDHVDGMGPAFFERACRLGLEGIVSKKRDAPYRPGRRDAWLKVKCTRSDEFVVGGFTAPAGSRRGFGALLLGAFDGDELVYVGRVGTGFTDRTLRDLHRRLSGLRRPDPPFRDRVPNAAGATWVEPELVVEVAFTERTRDGHLRHPTYRGLREDKTAGEVRTDGDATRAGPGPEPGGAAGRRATGTGAAGTGATGTGATGTGATGSAATRPRAARRGTGGRGADAEVAGVRLTNADRVLYPEQGVTKLDLARYYERVADGVLAAAARRPLSLVRCPQGHERQCFFQKHPGDSLAQRIPRVEVPGKDGSATYVYAERLEDLVALVQVGVLELHVWGSRVDDLERPDLLVFDLDPDPAVPWSYTRATARELRARLEALGLTSFLRTTGGKGLHLVVPLVPEAGWEEAKAFARDVSVAHAATDPARLTTTITKAKRRGKVLIDYLRNGRGATAIASFSTRARPGAPVAVPLRWDELREDVRSDRYDVRTAPRRVAALKDDPWEGFGRAARPLDASRLAGARDEAAAAGTRRRRGRR